MQSSFPLFPEQASTSAAQTDAVYFALLIASGILAALIAGLLLFFAIKYRAGSKADRTPPTPPTWKTELLIVGMPTVIALCIFFWAADVFLQARTAPRNTLDIYVVGKQWMWTIQHPGGQTEKNALHVPLGRPVKLIMTSQDVIHDFAIPAFRIKQDVLPGRYTTLWFTATKVGEYHLFCSQYCGTEHSNMTGTVYVMEPEKYAQWLGPGGSSPIPGTPGTPGAAMAVVPPSHPFAYLGCAACHLTNSNVRAPRLDGIFGRPVRLRNNQTVIADEQYIRESILNPNAKIAAGYELPGGQSLMPSFQGRVNDDEIRQLIEYIKSLSPDAAAPDGATTRPSP